MKICMVCLGNICRSPAAEGIFKKKFPHWIIDSAGTSAWHIGQPPDKRSIEVCQKHGVDISLQRARQITAKDGEKFDLLLAMDRQNIDDLYHIIDQKYHPKIHLIDHHEVNDPYYSASDGFEIMFQQLENATNRWKDTPV